MVGRVGSTDGKLFADAETIRSRDYILSGCIEDEGGLARVVDVQQIAIQVQVLI